MIAKRGVISQTEYFRLEDLPRRRKTIFRARSFRGRLEMAWKFARAAVESLLGHTVEIDAEVEK